MGHLTEPFRLRNEEDYLWRCEFWGKIVRSMILAWRSTGNAELLAKIRLAVKDILSTTGIGKATLYAYINKRDKDKRDGGPLANKG